ncbi:hypothetical protein Lalb_Chr09g0333731 [Lupinus albus]|uniref:Uncharacterized protein n=1 Tax=Lupinus albus TaxID=3870 RepID=A0A6A4Q2N3_LUPAL|nr:hypothetical protein Lalb_Chr09g0333731 [Lupinus albus]
MQSICLHNTMEMLRQLFSSYLLSLRVQKVELFFFYIILFKINFFYIRVKMLFSDHEIIGLSLGRVSLLMG